MPVNPVTTKPAAATTPGNIPAVNTVTTPPVVVGKVVWVKGTLTAIGPDKKEHILKAGAMLSANEVLVTDNNSQAEVIFSDQTITTFRENTKFYIKQYEYHPEVKEGSVGKYIMDLIEGGYRTVTGQIAKSNPSDYQVNTQVAIMGVRGTDYAAFFHACQTYMKYYHGKPILHNAKGTILLTGSSPYASVSSANAAPVVLAKQPAVFNVPLPIVPTTFNLSTASALVHGGGAGGAGNAKNCGTASGGNGFVVNFH
jgi:hypothetical protein